MNYLNFFKDYYLEFCKPNHIVLIYTNIFLHQYIYLPIFNSERESFGLSKLYELYLKIAF